MSDIQNIVITSTQVVTQPKPHTAYTIQISTPIRTWTVSRRYNDFVALHAELKSSTSKEPPAALPPKHSWTITRSVYDEKLVRERRVLLEAYLRAILTTKDDRWRKAYTFLDFLSVPSNTRPSGSNTENNNNQHSSSSTSSSVPAPPTTWTPQSWLSESTSLQSLLRLTRSSLLKRDALASMSDASGSRSSGIEAKRLLKDLSGRLDNLESALGGLKVGDGEKRRREEVVENLKVERDNLRRMIDAGVRTARDTSTTSTSGFSNSSSGGTMPGGSSALFAGIPSQPKPGRVFGRQQPPEETTETRPLDDRQLLQLQQMKMDNQDGQLGELSKILRRQRKMGEEIHQEIGEQSEMLDDIDNEVGKVGGKLQRAKRDMNKLN